MPALVGGFGNYLVPVQIGAPDWIMHTGVKLSRWFSLSKPSKFGPYLAGLWEGDGHIWVPSYDGGKPSKRYNPHFAITFAEVDYPLVRVLQSLIGGTIRHKIDNHAYVLTIVSISELINVIHIINGYLRTPKIDKFNTLITWINIKTKQNIATHKVDCSDLLSNAWLSGFIEADGSFDIRVSQTSTGSIKNRVSARLRLEQRQFDPVSLVSYSDIMSSIAEVFGTSLNTSTHNFQVQYFLIAASSAKARAIICNYFIMYPLFSSKRLNFQDWLVCHNLIVTNKHTSPEGRDTALKLKAGMNNKRTYLSWDHLESLKTY